MNDTPEQKESSDKPICSMAACLIRFEWINSKLVVMHDDIQSLSIKVSNGLTDRVVQVRKSVV